MDQIMNVNFQNLTEEEKETLLELCKKSQKKEVKKVLWIPDKGEKYYYITNEGIIDNNIFMNNHFDGWRIINNNCFKTKEEAEFELEKRNILYELRKFAIRNNTEEIDWDDTKQKKYYIYYDYKNKCLDANVVWSLRQFNNIYFSSREICEQVIEQIGENRIKKYLFNVEE